MTSASSAGRSPSQKDSSLGGHQGEVLRGDPSTSPGRRTTFRARPLKTDQGRAGKMLCRGQDLVSRLNDRALSNGAGRLVPGLAVES